MFDEKADETLVRAERRPVNAKWSLFGVVAVFVNEAKAAGDGEINLIGGDGKFAASHAPNLNIDFRPVKRRFIRNLDMVDACFLKNTSDHVLRLLPEFRFVNKLLSELGWIVRAEAHLILLESKNLEILQIHLIHRLEFLRELLPGAVDMGVVHLHRTDAHQSH